jgi:thiol-disulfide isomerase/thioredoxin
MHRIQLIRTTLIAGIASFAFLSLLFATENSKVSLIKGTWEDVQQIVKDNPGKIVVVDAWSTSCIPCMKEFPNLVKLQSSHEQEVVCVSFSCDYQGIKSKPPEFYEERVLKFLTKQKAEFTNILSTTEADVAYEEMGINSIPAVFVYGPDGKLAKKFDSESGEGGEEEPFTYKDVTALVEKLIPSK